MARKPKKEKNKKKKQQEADEAAPKQEVDAVKGFILIMILLTLCLAVFQIYKANELDQVETDLQVAMRNGPKLREMSREIEAYLDLIKNSEEIKLLNNYETFFQDIYASTDVQAAAEDVKVGKKEDQRNSKEGYTEWYWDINIDNLDRKAVAHFMHWVERRSPKAKAIEALIRRRDRDGAEEIWDARFRIGYRVATTTNR